MAKLSGSRSALRGKLRGRAKPKALPGLHPWALCLACGKSELAALNLGKAEFHAEARPNAAASRKGGTPRRVRCGAAKRATAAAR